MLMGSDKYFKMSDINKIGPSQIAGLAKQKFDQRAEYLDQVHAMRDKIKQQHPSYDNSEANLEAKKLVAPVPDDGQEKLVLWQEYEAQQNYDQNYDLE